MKRVGGLLARFKNLKAPERSVRLAVTQAIGELVGVVIDDGCIKTSNDGAVIHLSSSSVVKASVFENKECIIARINNILEKDQVSELR